MYRGVFFNDTATTEIYTHSLHDALPIWPTTTVTRTKTANAMTTSGSIGDSSRTPDWDVDTFRAAQGMRRCRPLRSRLHRSWCPDRKSTRLNSSHANISYAVFCLKKNYTV